MSTTISYMRNPSQSPLMPRPEPLLSSMRPEARAGVARLNAQLVRLLWMGLLLSPYVLLPLMPVAALTLWLLGIG